MSDLKPHSEIFVREHGDGYLAVEVRFNAENTHGCVWEVWKMTKEQYRCFVATHKMIHDEMKVYGGDK